MEQTLAYKNKSLSPEIRGILPKHAAREYRPIGDYAAIGDCRCIALISSQGAIEWLCLPYFSAPSVFAAILDRDNGGHFSIRPAGDFTGTRRYVDHTPVLEITYRAPSGVVRLTDSMPILTGPRHANTLHSEREVLRCIEVLEGEVELEIDYAPRPNYARASPVLRPRGRFGWSCTCGKHMLLLHADVPLRLTPDRCGLHGRVRLKCGAKRYLSLVYVGGETAVVAPLGRDADERVTATLSWWKGWTDQCRYQGPYRDAVLRSALALKLLTFQLSGAVIAAATSSLPEDIGGVRNWDYRYCWLRDASLTLGAFMDLGFETEGDAFLGWLLYSTRLGRPHLQVLYDVYGESEVPEYELHNLEGYRGSRPVRIGNDAHKQLQLDAYGSVVLAAFDYVERGGRLSPDEAKLLTGLGKAVCRLWRRPDHGIWEIRGGPQHYTYSKLMCWVALDRLLQLHARDQLRVPADAFRRERDAIAQAIESRAYSRELGGYAATFGSAEPDASLLLMAHYGYRPARDARMRATFEAIERELTRDDLVYRYPPGSDHLPSGEGAFLISSFWAVDYLAQCGEIRLAQKRFERLLEMASDLGLYAEQIEPASGEQLGNFPQAFSHVGLIVAALSLEAAQNPRATVA